MTDRQSNKQVERRTNGQTDGIGIQIDERTDGRTEYITKPEFNRVLQ